MLRHAVGGLLLLAACAPAYTPLPPSPLCSREACYSAPLVEVLRNHSPADGVITMAPDTGDLLVTRDARLYEDDLLRIFVRPARGYFTLGIVNREQQTFQVVWDAASYVSPHGVASGVHPGDTRLIDVGRTQLPTVVPPHARAIVLAVPRTNLADASGPAHIFDFIDMRRPYREYEGTRMQLLLPIRVGQETHEYTLIFALQDLGIPY